MEKHFIPIPQQQKVVVEGPLSASTQHIWVALHGYGQLSTYFSRHFRDLASEARAFVVPQGTSRFYLDGLVGRVGASWMTKEDRLVDIENQRVYLESVISWALTQAPKAQVHLLGFSQGVATFMRYLGYSKHHFGSAIAWAGSWPPDLDDKNVAALKAMHFKGFFGTEDEHIGPEKQQKILTHYKAEYKLDLPVEHYPGGHKFDRAILAREIEQLETQQ